ncbi:hypothetical protein L2E82_35917 [Cichorium intybus]|uniref:Uncharacterized protein n=1 Tax=Cichorium intybus TaxID=13427 RepID=A0ACB9BQG4_CICIN|nr:hypothetical protein L2E82_35917 [Cichorium intybus]
MQRCAASSRWLNERISLSRYSHVPLSNFELDWLIHTADVFFARALRDQQQILWVSDNGIPDLGGDNEEETCYSDEVWLDDATSCAPAFLVLKQLIQRCLTDAVSSGNIFADAMLQHLYRWLCSPQSKLHDPALYRMLQGDAKGVCTTAV